MTYSINRAAVIGAGTMGAAIAAHLANAGLPTYLLDIVPTELTPDEAAKGLSLDHPGVRNRIVDEGWNRCIRARPANLFTKETADLVTLGNLEDNFDWVGRVDWVVEAVIEQADVKQALMARIEERRRPNTIVSSNTSGIPIKTLAHGRSAEFMQHFLGTHFFNPPRYLKLLEIIPTLQTDPEIVEFMQRFCTDTLGKGVVICKDTPNFVANRLISIVGAHTINYALDNGYTISEVDLLTGPLIGYPKTGTFRLLDLVGIDVVAHIDRNLYPLIEGDSQRKQLAHKRRTEIVQEMLARNWLGNKTRQGYYKRVKTEAGRQFWELNLETLAYEPSAKTRFESVAEHGNIKDIGTRISKLCAADDRAGQFLWHILAFNLNYAASLVPDVCEDILSIDRADKWGFNHQLGPFEIWDAWGVASSLARMEANGMTVTPWVKDMVVAGNDRFYQHSGGTSAHYDPASQSYVLTKTEPKSTKLINLKADPKRVLASNPSADLLDLGDGVLCVEFHSKVNALDESIIDMLFSAREVLEKEWLGLVIGNQGEHFCAGANINALASAAQQGEWAQLDRFIRRAQDVLMAFRYSAKPVVSAPFGMVLGGGAEVMMGSAAICAAVESYIGQVEAGVGLVPAAGGCKELLRRVVSPVIRRNPHADPAPFVRQIFETIALGKVSANAEEARQWGFLSDHDRIIMNRDHLLMEAKQDVLNLATAGYRAPVRSEDKVWAMGANGLAGLQVLIWAQKEAGFASDHDALVANKAAYILCGGKLSRAQWVDPQYILNLEREAFLSLLGESKTIDRISHMLTTGKPLRN